MNISKIMKTTKGPGNILRIGSVAVRGFIVFLLILPKKINVVGMKLYFRVHHRDHFALDDEPEEQEYIKLGPESHLKRELDEYFDALKTTRPTTSNDEDELQKLVKKRPTVSRSEKSDKDTKTPWHATFTEPLQRIKHFLSEKLFGDTNSTFDYRLKYNYENETFFRYNGSETDVNVTDFSEMELQNLTENFPVSRTKRSKHYVNANEGWKLHYSTTGKPATNKDSFEITPEDVKEAEKSKIKTIITIIFVVLGFVLFISVIAYCFVKDPKTFCIAFGSGCPCLLYLCPCLVKSLEQYLEPTKLVQDSMNTYMPGVIIHEDGRLENYKPTPEEIECVMDIIDEIAS